MALSCKKDGEKINDINKRKRGLSKVGSSPRQKECRARKVGKRI